MDLAAFYSQKWLAPGFLTAFLAEDDSGGSVDFHAFNNLKHLKHLNHSSTFLLYILKGC